MLTVVLCKWNDTHHGYQGKFTAENVNVMANMIDRHYSDPHRLVCFTDDPACVDSRIETHPIWDDFAALPNPTGGGRPSCYRRLNLWRPGVADIVGPRFVQLDLDAVVCGDLRPLWNRPEPLVMYEDYHGQWPYSGAMYLMDTGCRPQVWDGFDPIHSPVQAAAKGYQGSDQAWINYALGEGEATWGKRDGVYRQLPGQFKQKPPNAKIVFTTGKRPPWSLGIGWMSKEYR